MYKLKQGGTNKVPPCLSLYIKQIWLLVPLPLTLLLAGSVTLLQEYFMYLCNKYQHRNK